MIAFVALSKTIGVDWANVEKELKDLPGDWETMYVKKRRPKDLEPVETLEVLGPRKTGG